MAELHLLVADGNSALVRERQMARTGSTFGTGFATLLQTLMPDCKTAICCPADGDAMAPAGGFEAYDGVVLTGSLLSAYEDLPEVRRQVAFLRAAADAARPDAFLPTTTFRGVPARGTPFFVPRHPRRRLCRLLAFAC
jgi:GMP synthase (glutamine-hydrolysing)